MFFSSCLKKQPGLSGTYLSFENSLAYDTMYYGGEAVRSIHLRISAVGAKPADPIPFTAKILYKNYEHNVKFYGSGVFPAGELSADFHIMDIDTSAIPAATPVYYIISIDSSLATYYPKANIRLEVYKQDFYDLFAGNFYCYESNYSNRYKVNIIPTNPRSDRFFIENFWDFAQIHHTVNMLVNKDKDRSLVLPNQIFTDAKGVNYTLEGEGNYNTSGEFSINYRLYTYPQNELIEEGLQEYKRN
jgi:hypothetical protein